MKDETPLSRFILHPSSLILLLVGALHGVEGVRGQRGRHLGDVAVAHLDGHGGIAQLGHARGEQPVVGLEGAEADLGVGFDQVANTQMVMDGRLPLLGLANLLRATRTSRPGISKQASSAKSAMTPSTSWALCRARYRRATSLGFMCPSLWLQA